MDTVMEGFHLNDLNALISLKDFSCGTLNGD